MARPVAYGSMLIECVVAVISLCAVGFVWKTVNADVWAFIQAILAALLVILALVLAVYSFMNLGKQAKEKKA